MFRTVPRPIIRSYSLYTQRRYISYRFVDKQVARKLSVWHIPLLSVQWITPDDGHRNCPKHVEFNFQNKLEKLVHLVCFIVRKLWHILPNYKITCTKYAVPSTESYCFTAFCSTNTWRWIIGRLVTVDWCHLMSLLHGWVSGGSVYICCLVLV
jgi:hypothetical protein